MEGRGGEVDWAAPEKSLKPGSPRRQTSHEWGQQIHVEESWIHSQTAAPRVVGFSAGAYGMKDVQNAKRRRMGTAVLQLGLFIAGTGVGFLVGYLLAASSGRYSIGPAGN